MSFNELVKQSLKTKEQIEQENQDERTRLINESNEQAINFILELIKKDIVYMAGTGNARGNEISNTVTIPHAHDSYNDYDGIPYSNIFDAKFNSNHDRTNHFFSYCNTTKYTMTVENIDRLMLVFSEVKKRALQDNISISDPFILITIRDYNNRHDIKGTKKEFMRHNKLSAKVITKTYGKGYTGWKGESGSLSLAIDYSYTI